MRQSELSDLAILSIELAEYIDFDKVIHETAAWRARKEKFMISRDVHRSSFEMLP